MKNIYCLLVLSTCVIATLSCKKEAQQIQQSNSASLEAGLVSFTIPGQLFPTVIDTNENVINIVVPHTVDLQNLTVNFSLANQVNAYVKNAAVNSGTTMDFSKIVYFTVTSNDKKHSTTFQLNVETDLYYYGLTGTLISEKSLNKSYNFYYDQWDGSTTAYANCGPAASTMAIKWADSTFTKKPADARAMFGPQGGWWSDRNVTDYLTYYGINNQTDTLSNVDSLIKVNIDKNQAVILCLDMFYIGYDNIPYQHLNKFYETDAPAWGHYIFVKGYKQTTNGFYLEVYDSYCQGLEYFPTIIPHEPRGEDRYYPSSDIKTATNLWDPYAFVLAPKGKTISGTAKLGASPAKKTIPIAHGQ